MTSRIFLFLLVATSTCLATDLSDEDKQMIVDMHNEYRVKVAQGQIEKQPVACDMKMLTWDDALAKTAQTWSDKCKLGHDRGSSRRTEEFYYVGQNFGASWNIKNIINAWFAEFKDYNYDTLTCSTVCGHYTQMIWANTTKIGCAATDCSKDETFSYGQTFVCNYGEAGNWNNYKPYRICTEGACGLCAEGTTCNGQKLCAKDCIFPFKYRGEWHKTCVDKKAWCSLDRDYQQKWKYC